MSESPVDTSSLPVDPHPDEWVLKDPMPPVAAAATGNSNANFVPSSSRLDALEKRGYDFPPLPSLLGSGHANGDDDVSWSYGTSSLARKKKAEISAKQRLQQQNEAQADNNTESSNTNTTPNMPPAAASSASSTNPLPTSFASRSSSKPRVHFRGGGSDVESDEDEDDETEEGGRSTNHDDDNTEERKSTGESEDVEMDTTSAASSSQQMRQSQHQKKKKARLEPLGEDPLYGAELDDEDQQWLHDHHSSHHLHSTSSATTQSRRAAAASSAASVPGISAATSSPSHGPARSHALGGPRTDAFLSCPACFTPVCIDCQRHATRPNYFRAMFVLNDLIVDKGRTVPPQPGSILEKGEKYVAVLCKVCKTHVGVLDQDEVYHFFNVLESQA